MHTYRLHALLGCLLLLFALTFARQSEVHGAEQAVGTAAKTTGQLTGTATVAKEGSGNGEAEIDDFMDWLNKCGAKIEHLGVKRAQVDGNEQLGVFVTGEAPEFSEVARIPLSCAITTASALEHPDLKPIWEAHPHLAEGRSPMAVQLLWEKHKGDASPMANWIRLLPKELDLPMMWKRKERQMLRGSYTLDRVLADIDGLVEDHEKIFVRAIFQTHRNLFPPSVFTLEEYMWAWSIIWSRNIEQRVSGVWGAYLIPFADMMNHGTTNGADLYINFGKTDLVIRLNGTVAPGEQLTRAYIPLAPNIELFRMYGFIDPTNPYIASSLKFSFDHKDPFFARRVSWAKKHRLDAATEYPYNDLYITNRGVPPNIPALLRIANFDFNSRDSALGSWSLKDAPDPFQRIENAVEERFFTFLRENLQNRMKEFTTTIEEDEVLLTRTDLSRREQLAIEIRLEEKVAMKGSIESLATTIVRFDEPIKLDRNRPIHYPKRASVRSIGQ